MSILSQALKTEKKRSAFLSKKLKKIMAEKQQLPELLEPMSITLGFMQRHSTMRKDQRAELDNSLLLTSMNNLSFASLNVPECKPNDGEEEIDRKSFEQWKDLLDASMQLGGVTDESVKISIFRIKAGPKLLDILEGTTGSEGLQSADTEPYSNAISRLKNFYGSRDYCLMQRQKLRSMAQGSGESDLKYVKRIVAAAKLCDYSDEVMVENVSDVIQSHAINPIVREIGRKLMRKGGSLADLLGKIRACEISKLNEDIFAKNHQQSNQVEIAAVSFKQNEGGFQPRRFSGGHQNTYNGQQKFTGNWKNTSIRGGTFLRENLPLIVSHVGDAQAVSMCQQLATRSTNSAGIANVKAISSELAVK
ncbi:uncharacterized protein LOC131683118 isoform X2 [Topomyia yanbarensis]|uniref:uncharacterized protein LOC131683118 isoform X2 n=1 Tax=Topomyia yanbarensis TaxID=2498891 RepID=UPI00273A8FC4|nr:uncharacterized protein LOC131683118 isoform X2 [Topomyia yanbarensis]